MDSTGKHNICGSSQGQVEDSTLEAMVPGTVLYKCIESEMFGHSNMFRLIVKFFTHLSKHPFWLDV